jgi:RNA polymerase sigma-70 factor (ECF subfamily)
MNQQAVDSAERALVKAAQRGNREARNRLITKHLSTIRSFVRRKVPIEDVEDITQEVALAATKSLSSFRGTGPFRAWLFTLARRVVADYHQDRSRTTQVDLTACSEADLLDAGGQEALEAVEARVYAKEVLAPLSQHQRTLLGLRVEERLTFAEIGGRIGVSEDTAKMQFQRAKLKISPG